MLPCTSAAGLLRVLRGSFSGTTHFASWQELAGGNQLSVHSSPSHRGPIQPQCLFRHLCPCTKVPVIHNGSTMKLVPCAGSCCCRVSEGGGARQPGVSGKLGTCSRGPICRRRRMESTVGMRDMCSDSRVGYSVITVGCVIEAVIWQ